ncbi:MAG: rhomboid family intramembrane serine protease [Beijerinckiaceae bacterium]
MDSSPAPREPIFNAPLTTLALAALLLAIHAIREWLLADGTNFRMVFDWGFIPARLPFLWAPEATADELRQLVDSARQTPAGGVTWLNGRLADELLHDGTAHPATIITHAGLHGGWAHVIINSLWLVAFGGAVDRRFGPIRYLLLGVISAIGGALAHMLFDPESLLPLIGASGVVSGYTGAMARFAFATGGPLGRWRAPGDDAFLYPAPPLGEFFRNQRALTFVALWFALNFLPSLASGAFGVGEEQIAWMAHIGGFAAGFFAFGLLDPVGRLPRATLH